FKVLFSGLPEEETARVVEELSKLGIPYTLGANNTMVSIPNDRVHEVRLEMAQLGLPKQGTGVGFEIFDQTSLVGMTDFMQRMNYQRALQGELSRTIENVAAVNSARVHLVLPKDSLFVSERREASASVILDLSRPMRPAQSDGIVHLIATAVAGLDEDNVTLVDQKGNLIAGGKSSPDDGRMPMDESLSLQRSIEKSLEEKAQTMLDPVLGAGKSIVRVTAELDLSRVERMEEVFDPEGQVPRSEQFVNESSRGVFGVGGVPGVQPNDPNAQAAMSGGGSDQSRSVEKETVNYEISKTVNKVLLPTGTIKRLSVAVLLDGKYVSPEQEGEPPKYEARSTEEIASYQKIIENAVGFNANRGDVIQVTNTAFEPIVMPAGSEGTPFWQMPEFYLQVLMWLVILGLLLFVLRPMVAKLLAPEKVGDDGLPRTVAELEQMLLADGVGSIPAEHPIRQMVPDRHSQMTQQLIADHLDEAREIVRGWMMEDG
ncbi:MAG: flagellar M-ring protein FliF, partial [Magnetococcales bacterium]|nr:flagellar M-ring protein FliF [Magnetococcales bacterium]